MRPSDEQIFEYLRRQGIAVEGDGRSAEEILRTKFPNDQLLEPMSRLEVRNAIDAINTRMCDSEERLCDLVRTEVRAQKTLAGVHAAIGGLTLLVVAVISVFGFDTFLDMTKGKAELAQLKAEVHDQQLALNQQHARLTRQQSLITETEVVINKFMVLIPIESMIQATEQDLASISIGLVDKETADRTRRRASAIGTLLDSDDTNRVVEEQNLALLEYLQQINLAIAGLGEMPPHEDIDGHRSEWKELQPSQVLSESEYGEFLNRALAYQSCVLGTIDLHEWRSVDIGQEKAQEVKTSLLRRAEKNFERAIWHDQSIARAHIGLGIVAKQSGLDAETVTAHYERGIMHARDDLQLSMASNNLASLLLREIQGDSGGDAGDYLTQARKHITTALSQSRRSAAAHVTWAEIETEWLLANADASGEDVDARVDEILRSVQTARNSGFNGLVGASESNLAREVPSLAKLDKLREGAKKEAFEILRSPRR